MQILNEKGVWGLMKNLMKNINLENYIEECCQKTSNSQNKLEFTLHEPILTVIIPAYNMEHYITRCIESIEKQNEIDIEIIIVNDGSTDKTRNVVEKLSKNYENIRIIDQTNIGLYHARANGVGYAKGKYITFVDADDTIVEDFYLSAVKIIDRSGADILEFGIRKVRGEEVLYEFSPPPNSYNGKEAIRRILEKNGTSCSNCNKIYNRSLFTNILFFEDIRCYEEDKLINVKVMCKADRVEVIPDIGYIYDTREGSITTGKISKGYLEMLKTSSIIYRYLKAHCPDLSDIAGRDYCAHLAYSYINLFLMDLDKEDEKRIRGQIRETFINIYREERLNRYKSKNDSFKRYVMINSFRISPWLPESIYRMYSMVGH